MERLTWEHRDGGIFVDWNIIQNSVFDNIGVCTGQPIERLSEYEDTGLTPGNQRKLYSLWK